MNPLTSSYLDAVRFAAAMSVFVGHLSGQRLTGGLLWQVAPYGPEAVAVFFVISGFVIGYATDTRERDAVAYTVARAARIYSVALPALLLTIVLDSVGSWLRPDLYSASWGFHPDGRLAQLVNCLLFINQLWFRDVPPGSDLPYWSLGFEVPYYVIFGIATYAPRRWRVAATLLGIVCAGPRIVAMFPIWLIGLASYRWGRHHLPGRLVGFALCGGSSVGWVAYEIWSWRSGRPLANGPVLFQIGDIAQSYVVGCLFALQLVGVRILSEGAPPLPDCVAKAISWTAGATFSLYLFHLPIAQFLASLSPFSVSSALSRALMLVGTLVIVFLLAEVSERRKAFWRRQFSGVVGRVREAGESG